MSSAANSKTHTARYVACQRRRLTHLWSCEPPTEPPSMGLWAHARLSPDCCRQQQILRHVPSCLHTHNKVTDRFPVRLRASKCTTHHAFKTTASYRVPDRRICASLDRCIS